MSMSLTELLGGSPMPTEKIILRGKEVVVTALSSRQEAEVLAEQPHPEPPLVPDTTRGSLAPSVADVNDPTYKKQVAEWWPKFQAARVAKALGVSESFTGVLELMTEREIDRVYELVDRLGDWTLKVDASIKN